MSACVTLLYPAPAGHTFDLNYYLKNHMPMVFKHWGPRGLKGYQIIKLEEDAGYSTQCIMHWESIDQFKKARDVKEEAEAIFGDIPNYTNQKPTVFVAGEVVDSKL